MSLKLHAFLSANYCQIYSPLVWNCCFDDCHVYIQPPWNVQRQLQPPGNATTYHGSSRDSCSKGAEKIGRFQVILTLPHISTKQLSRGGRSQKHAWLINLCAIGAPSTGAVIVTNQDLEHSGSNSFMMLLVITINMEDRFLVHSFDSDCFFFL